MTRSLAFPFAIDADVAISTGVDQDRTKVTNVLLTEQGELPWRTAFGASLDPLRHRPMDAVQVELLRVRCADALATWVPGIETAVEPGAVADTTITLRVAIGPDLHAGVEVER